MGPVEAGPPWAANPGPRCPRSGIARVPAVEVLLANPIVRKLIAEEREADIPTAIRGGRGEGMQDFTDSLEDLIKREMISLEEGMRCAPNVEELKMALKGVRASSGGLL